MPSLEPASRWSGRVRWTAASCAAAALLGGCALQQSLTPWHSTDDLEFLDRAITASSSARESMWRQSVAANRAQDSQDSQLRLALMQSVPDHAGYDPASAQRNLRSLLAQDPPSDIAAVARVRLDELRTTNQCVGENQALRRRLAQVVNIERELDNRGR